MAITPSESVPARTERRKFQKLKSRGKIEIEWGSATPIGTVSGISAEPTVIELTPKLWVGAHFSGRLAVERAIRLNCAVRRVDPGKGIAVTFEVLVESGKSQLMSTLTALPPA